MAKLIYTYSCSLDGYVADASGSFDWSAPTPQVHSFINDLERSVGTFLLGRRLYEVLRVWDELGGAGDPAEIQDYGEIWRAADKIVYSRTLDAPSAARTRIEREFDVDEVRRLVEDAPSDVAIGGAELAGHAIRAGLVDEFQLLLSPVLVGGGRKMLPDGVRVDLELLGQRRFDDGVVYLRYGRRA